MVIILIGMTPVQYLNSPPIKPIKPNARYSYGKAKPLPPPLIVLNTPILNEGWVRGGRQGIDNCQCFYVRCYARKGC